MIVKILDDNGQPIPGAVIRNKNKPAIRASTDENGIAVISEVGEYIISFVGTEEKIVNIIGDITVTLISNTVLNEVEIVAESPKNALIKGFIVDGEGNPLNSMGVKIFITPKEFNLTDIRTIYVKTNDKGYFEDNSLTKGLIESSDSLITINPLEYNHDVKYKIKEIDLSTIFSKIEVPLKYWMYDLGRINLEVAAKMPSVDEVVSQIKNEALEQAPKPKLGFEFSLSALQLKALNAALERLIPFLFGLLLTFGPQAVAAVFNKQKVLDKKCPKQSVILELVNKRNLTAKQINNIYNSVNTLNKILGTTNTFITSLNAALTLFPLIPYPATGIPPALPPITVGVISGIENGKETLKLTLEKITQGLRGTEFIIAYFAGVLAYLLYILGALDQLIQECAQDQNVPFDAINDELNSFVNESTGISNSTVIGTTQNNTYKGFILEIKLDITNKTKYPKRYAQALTRQGVPVLKTESSFASDPQVLVNQLKFIIDSNPNLIPE